jgi:hypothetical protein
MIDGVDFSGNGRGGDELFRSQRFGNAKAGLAGLSLSGIPSAWREAPNRAIKVSHNRYHCTTLALTY